MPFGAYVHIPFCARRCDYCAFATWTDRDHLIDAYVEALIVDIDAQTRAGDLPSVDTVFVGGGTPTRIPPRRLIDVIGSLPLAGDAEVTVEANPDDVTSEMLEVFRSGGVTRISLGVQSMSEHVLRSLGRSHDRDAVGNAVAAARSVGGLEINLDLIYGGAGESVADWSATVAAVVALEPDHVSAYALTVEAGTPLAADPARYPDDDDQADKYVVVDELLTEAGLINYEISNWARPGSECRHNLLYWRQQDYQGFGCAAHSHRSGRRFWNVRTPDRYIARVGAGESPVAAGESLDAPTRRLEGLQLALRTSDGVPAAAIETDEAMSHLVAVGDDGRARLTRAGRLLTNEVAVRLRVDRIDP